MDMTSRQRFTRVVLCAVLTAAHAFSAAQVTMADDAVVVTDSLVADSVGNDTVAADMDIELQEIQIQEMRRQTDTMSEIKTDGASHLGNASWMSVEQLVASQPGASTHNELSNQYNVRGGSFDENSVYVNGTEVYRPLLIRSGQQEGLSVINPDMVESIRFSAGGFEAKYSDKMSSALDITYRKAHQTEGSVSASPIGASAYVGAGNGRVSWTNAIRYKTVERLMETTDTDGDYDSDCMDFQTYLSWTVSPGWTFDVFGIIVSNRYETAPSSHTSEFGPYNMGASLDGHERDRFTTVTGSLKLTHQFNSLNSLAISAALFHANEKEDIDVNASYTVFSNDYKFGGKYHQYAYNKLTSSVFSLGLEGQSRIRLHNLRYGLTLRKENISDRLDEWELRDSASFVVDGSREPMNIYYAMSSDNSLGTTRFEAYAQDRWYKPLSAGELILNYGLRMSHWDFNKETIISPRASIAFIPASNDRLVFRFSTGLYYQAPFYKEFRETTSIGDTTHIRLNHDIKSQRSLHFILGGEYRFRANGNPMKATAEIYYKALSDIVPYMVDNLRVVYSGRNAGTGYAAGIDMRLYGEFVAGTDSWISIGLMRTRETVNGISRPRPTDQRFNFSMFFSDYFPGDDRWKCSFKAHYVDGRPVTFKSGQSTGASPRFPAYKRIDIGVSYRPYKCRLQSDLIKDIWIGADILNLFENKNVNSYLFVNDPATGEYAIPIYLTRRMLNLRILITL